MRPLRFIALITLLTSLFGIALDLVTANIWVDYFTVHHPKVLASQSPLVMALYWGVAASWWFGAIAALILWLFNQGWPKRRAHPIPDRTLIRWVACSLIALWFTMIAILGLIYALIGLIPLDKRRPTFDIDRRAMAVALTHQTEYILGAVVLIVLMILVARRSKQPVRP